MRNEGKGEMAQIINRAIHGRDQGEEWRRALGAEMADVLWFLVKLANRFDIDLGQEISPLLARMEASPPDEYAAELVAGLRSLASEIDLARDELDLSALASDG